MSVLFTIVLFLLSIQDQGMIEWSADRPLHWSDFQGDPVTSSPFAAQTDWAINYGASLKGDSITFDLRCYFTPSRSWVRQEKATELLLTHEQRHFDIAELYARRMRRAFAAHHWHQQSLEKEPGVLYEKYFKACSEMQRLYDRETDHSRDEERQVQWNERISRMLDDLKQWHSSRIAVGINH